MAKKHLDLDQIRSLQDPVSFKVNGKTYNCVPLTDELMDAVTEVAEDESAGPCETLKAQIALFTGTDAEEFDDLDLPKLKVIVEHITSALNDPLGKKKPRRAAS